MKVIAKVNVRAVRIKSTDIGVQLRARLHFPSCGRGSSIRGYHPLRPALPSVVLLIAEILGV